MTGTLTIRDLVTTGMIIWQDKWVVSDYRLKERERERERERRMSGKVI